MGETCGLKIVYETKTEPDVCKLCHDTERKQRRYDKMYRDVQRWQDEGNRSATIERTCGEMQTIMGQIYQMREEHDYRPYSLAGCITFWWFDALLHVFTNTKLDNTPSIKTKLDSTP
ncbi:hypothetical protein LCI18_006567 [Fusarium solani-melongenae]|uniref:Uncharacterized protein n=1 Tax=Fusarium solani subsp. cucurbitae TaxID=2747967 RepID=A0ACD3Z3G2_FUSSC|nr:hypothetical protein LCI18_006567 [Fusarium solani-melongenae]